jgi:hypothetical protein
VTADNKGNVIVTSNRYAKLRSHHGKSAKSGGNIAFYSKEGLLTKRITNEDFQEFGLYLLEKPQCVAVDNKNNIKRLEVTITFPLLSAVTKLSPKLSMFVSAKTCPVPSFSNTLTLKRL